MTPPAEPVDPFQGDPDDPAHELAALDGGGEGARTLSADELEDVLEELEDLEVFEVLLTPRGVRGLVVECEECHEPHYFGWDLLRSNLRHLLDQGTTRVHEPAFSPDPSDYVSYDYARGFADATMEG